MSSVPATLPSVAQSWACCQVASSVGRARKYVLPAAVPTLGVTPSRPPQGPGQMSASRCVPSVVPSEDQSSRPCSGSQPGNKSALSIVPGEGSAAGIPGGAPTTRAVVEGSPAELHTCGPSSESCATKTQRPPIRAKPAEARSICTPGGT